VDEGEVVVGFAVFAGRDPWSCFQPGVCAFDRPAVACLRVADFQPALFAAPDLADVRAGRDRVAGSAWLADPRLDRALAQCLLERGGGVAAVGPQLVRFDPAGKQLVDERQQVSTLVFVSAGEPRDQGRAVCVYGQVDTAAGAAPDRARDLLAPFFASTSDASTITRDQSSRSASASSSCKTDNARTNNPRPDHSSRRRRQVSPLGKPSSR
jgi:hypothetical protein